MVFLEGPLFTSPLLKSHNTSSKDIANSVNPSRIFNTVGFFENLRARINLLYG